MAKPTIYNTLWPIIKFNQYKNIAEVGVDSGYTSSLLAKMLQDNLTKYYLVDPWKVYSGEGAGSLARVCQKEWDKKYEGVLELKEKYEFIEVIRDTSYRASKTIENRSLDMVFIDANHDYENCYDDILLWSQKIKRGGAIMGHDYSRFYPGIIRAVDQLLPNVINIHGSIWGCKIV